MTLILAMRLSETVQARVVAAGQSVINCRQQSVGYWPSHRAVLLDDFLHGWQLELPLNYLDLSWRQGSKAA